MKLLRSVEALREFRRSVRGRAGFVPTMGALHAGHLSLVRCAIEDNDTTLVSIYVNPTQFNNQQDLQNYPDTLGQDQEMLEQLGVDAVFLPEYRDLYPDDFNYEIDEKSFSRELCGAHRPGHFKGVLTVVMKLLNLVRPDRAYFGEKDFQQLTLVRGMVKAFFLETEIIGCPTVREKDGLAMSSRNINLAADQRTEAYRFHEWLTCQGDDSSVSAGLEHAGFEVEYVQTINGRRYGAVIAGSGDQAVRLIDNTLVG